MVGGRVVDGWVGVGGVGGAARTRGEGGGAFRCSARWGVARPHGAAQGFMCDVGVEGGVRHGYIGGCGLGSTAQLSTQFGECEASEQRGPRKRVWAGA